MAQRIRIEAVVGKPRHQIWTLFNQPEHIVKWNFASDDWHCPRAENELSVGGRICHRMEAKDGSFGFDFEGVYDAVEVYLRLAYTMPDGRQVETSFADAGAGTRVTTAFDSDGENPADTQRAGWQAILDNFKRYAESQ